MRIFMSIQPEALSLGNDQSSELGLAFVESMIP